MAEERYCPPASVATSLLYSLVAVGTYSPTGPPTGTYTSSYYLAPRLTLVYASIFPHNFASLWSLFWTPSTSTHENMLGILVSVYLQISFLSNHRLCIPSATLFPSHESHLEFMGTALLSLAELAEHRCAVSVRDHTDVVLFYCCLRMAPM
jgi:hypothetical protein